MVADIERFLREHEVIPKPRRPPATKLRDPDDAWILASALPGRADILVTGDRDLLSLAGDVPLRIVDPRGFWTLLREGGS